MKERQKEGAREKKRKEKTDKDIKVRDKGGKHKKEKGNRNREGVVKEFSSAERRKRMKNVKDKVD